MICFKKMKTLFLHKNSEFVRKKKAVGKMRKFGGI